MSKPSTRVPLGRRSGRYWLVAALTGVSLSVATAALGQNDVNQPPPNVLLLVDTSGSMEYTSSRAACPNPNKPCLPECYPGSADPAQHGKSRWIEVVEVLTGSIQGYACYAHNRNHPDFEDEFRLGTVSPYDEAYEFPYSRPVSNGCVPGAGSLPPVTSPYEFPSDAIRYRPFNSSTSKIDYSGSTCSNFVQTGDGLLDSFNGQVRFALMTFDTHTDFRSGVDTGGSADYAGGVSGTWSYYLPGITCPAGGTTSYCSGKPANCATAFPQEVGARNAAAPPWEGRMVAFGPPNATAAELTLRNQWIQQVLLATRPYGATPIAGLLHDARNFLWNDTTDDPLNPGQKFGPSGDSLLIPGCRENTIILLSDGEPNLDLRPFCEVGDGVCPYDTPQEIARDLANDPDPTRSTRVYVVGFAVSEVDPDGDGTFTPCEDLGSSSYCTDPQYASDRDLKACCTLNEIAFEGTPVSEQGDPDVLDHALFAKDAAELREAIAEILSRTLGSVTARTTPVFTSTAVASTLAKAFQFTSGVSVRTFDLWQGVLNRRRLTCDTQTNEAEEEAFDPSLGDDFIANTNADPAPRQFFSVVGEDDSGAVHSDWSIRPFVTGDPDGAGDYSGTQTPLAGASTFAGLVTPEAMGLDEASCDDVTGNRTASECRDRYLRWLVGIDNGTPEHRCPNPGDKDCNLIADIFHSTPVVRGKPDEALRDEAYQRFAGTLANRDTFLYTSSNDGFLHSFYLSPGVTGGPEVNSQRNNETWAFIPPAVLPSIASMYPSSHLPLLDSRAVIKDVIATGSTFPFQLERKASDVESGIGTYRTILVQSLGPMRGGYFAVDITKPKPVANDPGSGPKFLWQLTTDANGDPLFGRASGTPLITTVFLRTTSLLGGTETKEVAVAVLPGGDGGLRTGTACPGGPLMETDFSSPPRASVNCYTSAANEARSLTIVRLDTGEILRTFRDSSLFSILPPSLSALLTDTELASPIVGEPAAFPAQTGAVADRVFVGDRDGRLWRVDLSDVDPSRWTMRVFFDAYAEAQALADAQPIVTAPVLSVDDIGNITVAVSTGDQEVLTRTTGVKNYVYSLTEQISATSGDFMSHYNYRHIFVDGERVAGPMTLFDRKLFFAAFSPDAGGACEQGTSDVWGVNYIQPKDASARDLGGAPEFADPASPAAPRMQKLSQVDPTNFPVDGVVFGVGIRQQPTCSAVTQSVTDDQILGFGQTVSTTQATPGKFELVIQLPGQSPQTGMVPTQVIDLREAPLSPVSIDSWALILE